LTRYFQFDKLIINIKTRLDNKQIDDVSDEKIRLIKSKKELHEAVQIILIVETLKDSLSSARKEDLNKKYNKRLNSLDEVKELVSRYHERLYNTLYIVSNNEEEVRNNGEEVGMDFGNNDLEENLLLEESKRGLEETAKNLKDAQTLIYQQKEKLGNVPMRISSGEAEIRLSSNHIKSISRRSFYIKLLLNIIALLLAIAIIAGLVLKIINEYKQDQNGNSQ
jgi:hypothetical protein